MRLIRNTWPATGELPTGEPVVTLNYSNAAIEAYGNSVGPVTRLFNTGPHNIKSDMWLISPPSGTTVRNMLMVYCAGHGADVGRWGSHWGQLPLTDGVHVLVVDMPGVGVNSLVNDFGNPPLDHGTIFGQAEIAGTRTLRIILEPIVKALNYCVRVLGPSRIGCMGLSGGGMTTDFVAAIDTRVTRCYPVAGSLPHDIRHAEEHGDFEESFADMWHYRVVGTEVSALRRVYALGALGARRRVQVLNLNDDETFWGATVGPAAKGSPATPNRPADILAYEAEVRSLLNGRGDFSVRVENTVGHNMHPPTLAFIRQDFLS